MAGYRDFFHKMFISQIGYLDFVAALLYAGKDEPAIGFGSFEMHIFAPGILKRHVGTGQGGIVFVHCFPFYGKILSRQAHGKEQGNC